MFRAHRELSIHAGVIDFHGLSVELRHLGMGASCRWLAAPAGSGTQPIGGGFGYSQEPRWGSKVRGYEVIAGGGLGFLLTTRVVLAVGARTSHGTFVRAARVSIATWRGDG